MIGRRFLRLLVLAGLVVGCNRDALVGRWGQPSGSGGQAMSVSGGSGGWGSGGAGGQLVDSGQSGSTGGRISHPDAGSADAAGPVDDASDAAVRCRVQVDAGSVPCTTALSAAAAYDYFCGLKGGVLNCWGSSPVGSLVVAAAPIVAAAPPNLVQMAMSANALTDHTFCGVDESTRGSCWTDAGNRDLGTGLRAVSVSPWGACKLAMDGTVACDNGISLVSPTPPYVEIVVSDDALFGLEQTGVPSFAFATFSPGSYTEITANVGYRLGAIRSDGTAVTTTGSAMTRSGSYLHLAVDSVGRACAIDQTGNLNCWISQTTSTASLFASLPPGPFAQIVGGGASFCALRATGTSACWGDQEIVVPEGW